MNGTTLKETVLNLSLLFFRLLQGIFSRDFSSSGHLLISLSPRINSVNDYVGFYCRRFSFERYGYWGYCPLTDGGTHYGAMYAFLSNFLTWKWGLSGYTLYALAVYILLFVLLSLFSPMSHAWAFIPVGLLAMYSPYYKNSLFACSRHDVPGWALLFMGLLLTRCSNPIPSLVALSLAFMTHHSIAMVGSAYVLIGVVFGLIPPEYLLVVLAAHGLNLFWYIPFVKIFWKRIVLMHSWSKKMEDRTRTPGIHAKKALGMLVFISCLLFSRPGEEAIFYALMPFLLYLTTVWKEQFVNRFAVELIWICSAGAACALTSAHWLFLPYLFSLYLYASPSPRFGFPFKPLLIERDAFFEAFSPLSRELPSNARIGLVFPFSTSEEYRRDAKHIFLLSTWIHHSEKYIDYFMVSPRLNESGAIEDSELASLSERYGFTYLLTASSYSGKLDESKDLRKVASCSLFSIGSVPGTGFSLYRCLKDYPRVLPEGEITNHRRGLSIRCSPGSHEIKYRPVPGLRAFQDHTELRIREFREFSFQIHSKNHSEIEIRFDLGKLWLDLWPWKWRHNQNP